MLIEQPPYLYRMLYPETIWRIPVPGKEKNIYLTFDDGPIPEVTPWVLNLLDHYQVKATFFCVGENVARNRELYEEIKLRGHSTGNHTMNHIQGIKYTTQNYVRNDSDLLTVTCVSLNSSLYKNSIIILSCGMW